MCNCAEPLLLQEATIFMWSLLIKAPVTEHGTSGISRMKCLNSLISRSLPDYLLILYLRSFHPHTLHLVVCDFVKYHYAAPGLLHASHLSQWIYWTLHLCFWLLPKMNASAFGHRVYCRAFHDHQPDVLLPHQGSPWSFAAGLHTETVCIQHGGIWASAAMTRSLQTSNKTLQQFGSIQPQIFTSTLCPESVQRAVFHQLAGLLPPPLYASPEMRHPSVFFPCFTAANLNICPCWAAVFFSFNSFKVISHNGWWQAAVHLSSYSLSDIYSERDHVIRLKADKESVALFLWNYNIPHYVFLTWNLGSIRLHSSCWVCSMVKHYEYDGRDLT